MCPFFFSTARLCEVVAPALQEACQAELVNRGWCRTCRLVTLQAVAFRACHRHCRQDNMQTYVALMQRTSNLIDDSVKRVVCVDLVHSLLGVINHLICAQILHL